MLGRLIIPTSPQKNPGGPTKVVVRAATIAGRQGFARGFENERNGQQSSRQPLSIASASIQNFDDPIAPELCFMFEGPVLENFLFARRFRQRQRMMAVAQAPGISTEEDVFTRLS